MGYRRVYSLQVGHSPKQPFDHNPRSLQCPQMRVDIQKRSISVPVDGFMAIETDAPAIRLIPAGFLFPAPFKVMPASGFGPATTTFARLLFAVSLKRLIAASCFISSSTRFFDGRFPLDGLAGFWLSPGRLWDGSERNHVINWEGVMWPMSPHFVGSSPLGVMRLVVKILEC